jgi:predicted dehydrogenase
MSFFSTRRDFLKVAGLTGAATMVGSLGATLPVRKHAHVGSLACAPLETVKVGIIGLGMRGPGAVSRLSAIPGVRVTALSDLYQARVDARNAWLAQNGFSTAKAYYGSEDEWKKLVEDPEVNLVYIATPWQMHATMVLYALECGKHVACEVPMVFSVEESWQIINKAEEKRVHCMLLENCCYGENEMLALNLVRNNILGTLVHGEGAYIHDLRGWNFRGEGSYEGFWRLKWNAQHTGNPYATHGLGPICQYMNIGRGDQMRVLTAMSTANIGYSEYVKAHQAQLDALAAKSNGTKYGMTDRQALTGPWAMGDMSTALIKTEQGRTIMVQHDTTSPRPYTRLNLISGTRGILKDYPLQIALDPNYEAPHLGWANQAQMNEIRAKFRHPLWRESGEIAKKMGGHGGMDFLMDLRLCYCLQNGLPLDINVYESCQWSVLAELTETSAKNDGAPVTVPDFTRGAWKEIAPLGIESVNINLDADKAKTDKQLSV